MRIGFKPGDQRPTIRRLRRMADLTQAQLAAQLGVNPRTVYLWEQGRVMPAGENLLKLAAIFGVDPRSLALNDDKCTAESIPGQVPIGDQAS